MPRMSVDRTGRDHIAKTLAAYLRGEIDNFALDDENFKTCSQDVTLREIQMAIWCCYDDCKRHSAHGSPETWSGLVRCVAFLKTDRELPLRPRRFDWRFIEGAVSLLTIAISGYCAYVAGSVWQFFLCLVPVSIVLFAVDHLADRNRQPAPPSFMPFESEADWLAHKPLSDAENIPPHDPATHCKRIRSEFATALMYIPSIFVLQPYIALFHLIHLLPRRR